MSQLDEDNWRSARISNLERLKHIGYFQLRSRACPVDLEQGSSPWSQLLVSVDIFVLQSVHTLGLNHSLEQDRNTEIRLSGKTHKLVYCCRSELCADDMFDRPVYEERARSSTSCLAHWEADHLAVAHPAPTEIALRHHP